MEFFVPSAIEHLANIWYFRQFLHVITPGAGDAFSFVHDGQRLQYSSKTTVNYNNKAQNVTLTWDLMQDDKAIKGKYIVQVFTDDQFLGESYFTLK